jgi:topoisomerase-4 subunit A
MLLGIRIRRISRFDIDKNRKDIDAILTELEVVKKHLKRLVPYAVNYLKGLLKTYGDPYPRRTQIDTFKTIEVRELTAKELQIYHDKDKGFIGHTIKGDPLLECSSYDKIFLLWSTGGYKVVPPPDKLFVDKTLLMCAKADRQRILTAVYTLDDFTYMKRFKVGGTIMNKDYQCAPEGSKILLLSEGTPETIYVKYKPAKGQRIHQQQFHPGDIPVKSAKAKGNQMTAKAIARISADKPRWWSNGKDAPRGRMI